VAGEIGGTRPARRTNRDDEDRPMTRAELRMANLESKFEQFLAAQANAPKQQDNTLGTVVQMMIESNKANAEVMKEVSRAGGVNEAKNRELVMTIMQSTMDKASTMASSSDKQFEFMLKMLDRKDDQKSSELAHMIKLMEFGANMRESGSAEGTPWWQELLGGVGQLGAVVAEKLGGGQPAMANFVAQPRMPNPQPQRQLQNLPPQPPLPGAVQIDPNQIQSADAVVLPVEVVAPVAQAPQQGESNVPVNPSDLGVTVQAVIDSILAQKDTKPNNAEWVEIAYQDLPYEIVKQIANTQDPKELQGLVEPYVGFALKIKAAAILQSDPLMIPWLKRGFEELQSMCRDQVAEMEPGTAAPQDDNVVETPGGPQS
jgi:hypothetical protein